MMFRITEVVKNLLIINGLFFLALVTFGDFMVEHFSLFYPWSDHFYPYQLVTHMFMHADLGHLVGNMFALVIFGSMVEERIGSKRFLILYAIAGLGASLLHMGSITAEVYPTILSADPVALARVKAEGLSILFNGQNYSDSYLASLNYAVNGRTVGASGAVFGVLAAAAMLFPNRQIMLLIPPIPLRIQTLALLYAGYEVLELFRNSPDDNVAHLAHIGGMLFAYLVIRFWRKRTIL